MVTTRRGPHRHPTRNVSLLRMAALAEAYERLLAVEACGEGDALTRARAETDRAAAALAAAVTGFAGLHFGGWLYQARKDGSLARRKSPLSDGSLMAVLFSGGAIQ